MACYMLRLETKLGVIWIFCRSFLLGALSGNRHSSTSFGTEATSRGNVSRMSVDGRRKNIELTDKKKKHVQKIKIAFVERAIYLTQTEHSL